MLIRLEHFARTPSSIYCWFGSESVPLIIYLLSAFKFFTSLLELQKTLQWWHYRQSLHLQHQVEKIRDGLLQEVFSVRRGIELLQTDEVSIFDNERQAWLAKVKQVHESLDQISHHLLPFYSEESLPLAIQYALELQKQQNLELNFWAELPAEWMNEPPERSRAILTIINELLQIALPSLAIHQPLGIQLKTQRCLGKLVIQISYPNQSAIDSCCQSKELRYLEQCFRLLTSGWCVHQRQGLVVTWYFYWRLG